ncbi:MAG: hypothetical protein C0417_10465 [Chlorobiaceae bacterium]|nr:hypothetical protein [Chlorobiaceae bacterium]
MKTFIFLTVFLLFFEIPIFAQSNNLRLEVYLSKNIFLKGEQIYLNNLLINKGEQSIKSRKLKPCDLYYKVKIKNSTGNIFKYLNNIQYFRDTALSLLLPPNDTVNQMLELIGNYSPIKQNWTSLTTKCFFPVDKYSIYTTLETGYGITSSNELSFEVIEPNGEDLSAFNMLEEASEYFIKRDFKTSARILNSIQDKYPKSPYSLQALRQIMAMYTFTENPDEQKVGYDAAMKLIETSPASEAADYALTHILARTGKILTTQEIRKNLLQKISISHPNTEIGRRASNIIKKYYDK